MVFPEMLLKVLTPCIKQNVKEGKVEGNSETLPVLQIKSHKGLKEVSGGEI